MLYVYDVTCAICRRPRQYRQTNTRVPRTCGKPSCVSELKRRSRVASREDWRRLNALRASPKTGPYATHHAARRWSLKSPDGDVHIFSNLSLFIRDNLELFDLADAKFNNHSCNANVYLGKLRPRDDGGHWKQWKGWTWFTPAADAPLAGLPDQPAEPSAG